MDNSKDSDIRNLESQHDEEASQSKKSQELEEDVVQQKKTEEEVEEVKQEENDPQVFQSERQKSEKSLVSHRSYVSKSSQRYNKIEDINEKSPIKASENVDEADQEIIVEKENQDQQNEIDDLASSNQSDQQASKSQKSGETQGRNLGDVAGDIPDQFAKSQKIQQQNIDDNSFNQLMNFEQYTEVKKGQDEKKGEPSSMVDNIGFMDDEEIQPNPTGMTNEQFQHVKDSWNQLINQYSLEKFGLILFRQLFKISPETLQLFPFKDIPLSNLFKDSSFKNHILRVATTLDKVIQKIENLPNEVDLKELGMRHIKYGVKEEDYPVFCQAIITTMSMGLQNKFTPDVKEAWIKCCKFISSSMISNNYQIESSNVNEFEIQANDDLDEKKTRLIQQSWMLIQQFGLQKFGVVLFKQIFLVSPELINQFPFKDEENLMDSQIFMDHTLKVASSIGTAIEYIEDLENLTPYLKQLGLKHKKIGVQKQQYPLFLNAMIQAFSECLQDQFTDEVRQAWLIVGNLIQETMISDHYCSQNQTDIDSKTKSLESQNDKQRVKLIEVEEEVSNEQEMSVEIQQEVENSMVEQSRASISQSMKMDELSVQLNQQDENNYEESEQTISDELNNDVQFNTSKQQLLADEAQQYMSSDVKKKIQDHYINIFKKEVDFHHKVAYRFEKAYRLGKKTSERKQTLNLEIIDCISEHSGYVEQDPMTLFYCLYFCIYYNNADLVEFLRTLIQKIPHIERIDKLLELIDLNGVERIRQKSDPINSMVYHMVFYQAMDDHLRIIYSKILSQLRLIQLRDKDALILLNTRDYDLIKLCLEKHVAKLNLTLFFKEAFPLKASTYRKYSQAYFEEIVINNDVEARCASNFRERFLITAEDIYTVFQMYCKEDYYEQFIATKKNDITPKQFRELFIICLRNDSIRVAMLIYTLYLNHEEDMDQKMMDIVMWSIKDSQYFHEFKLFFLHQHFNVLTIQQLDRLIDIYHQVVNEKEIERNAMISQYNIIKISLLIYRICWKVEQKQIYSLITKCQLLQNFLLESLMKYFQLQNNILTLHKFMTEPIFHMSETKDSLDIMLEMDLKELLKHPIVIEVLNLVYEGKYSASNSSLSLSLTYCCLSEMDTFSLKNIFSRLIHNITNFGDGGNSRQTNLQYNIWKQSIQQREQDEMILMVIMAASLIFTSFLITLELVAGSDISKQTFGVHIYENPAVLKGADEAIKSVFCQRFIPQLQMQKSVINVQQFLVALMTVGLTSSMCQVLATYRLKDNVTLEYFQILIQLGLLIVGMIFINIMSKTPQGTFFLLDQCLPFVNLDQSEIKEVNKILYLFNTQPGDLSFNFVISAIIVLSTIISVIMLQRTKVMGELIMMCNEIVVELLRFFATFGFYLLITFMLGVFLKQMYRLEEQADFVVFLDLFSAFNGIANFADFTVPIGQSYISLFMYCVRVLLISLLASMFIDRYRQVWTDIDAHRYLRIIKLKNKISYDKYVGCITLSFFPLNILISPFIPLIIQMRSTRISDFMLKFQYGVMMILYCFLALLIILPLAPLLYCKLLLNSFFIAFNNTRSKYPGQNYIQLIRAMFLGPPVILVSIIVDFLHLPIELFKPSRSFEHKYQMSQDRLDDTQLNRFIPVIVRIIYGQYWQKFKGAVFVLVKLMHMHRKSMQLIDFMHDFFCIGSKDYQQALANIQDYNGTKILSSKSCIPSTCGQFKNSKVHLNVFWAVQMDIERYNYVDILFRKYKMGILQNEVREAEQSKTTIKRGKFDQACSELVWGEKADDAQLAELQEETGYVDGAYATGLGPDGALLKRNNTDFMNNFFITICVRSFTNIESQMQEDRNSGPGRSNDKFRKILDNQQEKWDKLLLEAYKDSCDHYFKFVNKHIDQRSSLASSLQSSITNTNDASSSFGKKN